MTKVAVCGEKRNNMAEIGVLKFSSSGTSEKKGIQEYIIIIYRDVYVCKLGIGVL